MVTYTVPMGLQDRDYYWRDRDEVLKKKLRVRVGLVLPRSLLRPPPIPSLHPLLALLLTVVLCGGVFLLVRFLVAHFGHS